MNATCSRWHNWAAALGLLLSLGVTHTHAAEACNTKALAYAGSENGRVYALRVDTCAGQLALVGDMAQVPRPRWLTPHPTLPVLYVAGEGDGKQGSVVAFTRDRASGALIRQSEVPAGGAGTTHLWLDAPAGVLLAANFGGGNVSSIQVQADGQLGALVSTIQAVGSGPDRRQTGPRAHGVALDPSGRFALVADLGADRLFVYGFDRSRRALTQDDAAEPRALRAPAGSGPRHFVFHPSGQFVYLLNELTAELMVLGWHAPSGRLSLLHSLPINSAGFSGVRSGSEIAFGRDGRFLYVGNRSDNTLVVYRVSPDSGALAEVQRLPAGGDAPWAFDIDLTGRWLLVANFRSDNMRLFGIDRETGRLADTGQAIALPGPRSVAFMP